MTTPALETPTTPALEPAPTAAAAAPTADTPDPVAQARAESTEKWLEAEKAWQTRFDADWEHQRIEFHGDYLAVRTPKQAALTAVTLAGSKNGAEDGGLGMLNLFLNLYVGPESRERIDARMLDPEELNYGDYPLQALFQKMSELISE